MSQFLVGIIVNLIASSIIFGLGHIRDRYLPLLTRRDPRLQNYTLLSLLLIWVVANVTINYLLIEVLSLTVSETLILVLFLQLSTSFVLFIYILRELKQFWRIGIGGADRRIRTGVDYRQALTLCQNRLWFLGTGAAKLSVEEEFEDALLRCRPDQRIRFLLMKPTDANLVDAARRAGKDRDEYRNIVVSSLRRIAEIKQHRALHLLEVRFYDDTPIFRLMFIDDSICLVSYNVFGEGDGSQLPQLHILKPSDRERVVNSFFYPMELYFCSIWDSATVWDFERYL